MQFTRRDTLQLGVTGLAGFGATTFMPFTARAQGKGDSYKTESGEILVSPVSHASFVMSVPGLVIYNDPVGGKALYEGQPAAGLVLITHEHQDHFEPDTLAAIVGADTKLVVNPSVMEKLPADLKAKATAIGNGENTTVGSVTIEAIPAYNTTEDRKKYHPQGRDNGYVLTIDGSRVYIAGDTEDIPEMRALNGHRHRLRADEPALHHGHRPGELGGGGVQAGRRLSLSLRGTGPAGLRDQGDGRRTRYQGGAGKLVRLRAYFSFARIALEDSRERGPWMKVQAGAFMRARRGASASSTRA